jgi:hypothetical protein
VLKPGGLRRRDKRFKFGMSSNGRTREFLSLFIYSKQNPARCIRGKAGGSSK